MEQMRMCITNRGNERPLRSNEFKLAITKAIIVLNNTTRILKLNPIWGVTKQVVRISINGIQFIKATGNLESQFLKYSRFNLSFVNNPELKNITYGIRWQYF